jgi:hypothetical protein
MHPVRITAVFAVFTILAFPLIAADTRAQTGHPQTAHPMMDHAMPNGAAAASQTGPTLAGQDAFAAIKEIVGILDADPTTDWSRVNIDALREHLIDMNEVTLNARAQAEPIEGGVRIRVTGTGRTQDAIRRMVPAHAREINGWYGWKVATTPVEGGVVLTVTSADPSKVARIRGLGFMGIMVLGPHHQIHHLAMARGEMPHP